MRDLNPHLTLDPALVAQALAICTGEIRDPAQVQPIMQQLNALDYDLLALVDAAERAVLYGEFIASAG